MISDLIRFIKLGISLYFRLIWWGIMLIVLCSLGTFVASLFSGRAHADDWICKSQASERRGNTFFTCGLAEEKNEADARAHALENAQAEFTSLCRASDDCVGQSILVQPARTDCETTQAGVRCYRAVIYSIEYVLGGQSLSSNQPAKSYRADRQSPKSQISTGMTKAELLERFGKPNSVIKYFEGGYGFAYKGEMCVYKTMQCWVDLQDGHVTNTTDVKPEYTDLLK